MAAASIPPPSISCSRISGSQRSSSDRQDGLGLTLTARGGWASAIRCSLRSSRRRCAATTTGASRWHVSNSSAARSRRRTPACFRASGRLPRRTARSARCSRARRSRASTDRTTGSRCTSVNWEIDLWGRIRRQTEAAKADLWAAEYARRGIALSLAASVAQGYFTLRGLDAQFEIAQRTLDARGHALDIFTLRRAHGVISDMELSQARDDYFATQAAIPPLRANIVRIENALSVLLGHEPGPIERGRAISLMTLPPLAADPPINLLSRRPDLLRAEQGAVAANALFGAAQTLHLPSLSLSGFIGQAAGSTGALWHGASQIWGISAGLSQPIFQGGAIRGHVRITDSQREQALLAYQGAMLKAIAEVDDALVGAQQSAARLSSLNSQKDALAVYADQASARHESRYSSFLEVTNAQEKLFNAQLTDVQGRVDLLGAYVALCKTLGGGWASVPRDVQKAAICPSCPRRLALRNKALPIEFRKIPTAWRRPGLHNLPQAFWRTGVASPSPGYRRCGIRQVQA
ncbi:TolC family protein [Burkholderia stabilis]|uniref:TolC family protein n=1 Tax=Burkholderia stabilis TaxID=95485 RepID=UPI001F0C041C|nr:efflux transporter outer membrane subunit [Burkholderia stabilis]